MNPDFPEKVIGTITYDIVDADVYRASPYSGHAVHRSQEGRIGVFVDLCCARINGQYYCARQSKQQILTDNPRSYSLVDAEGFTYCNMHTKCFKMQIPNDISDESDTCE